MRQETVGALNIYTRTRNAPRRPGQPTGWSEIVFDPEVQFDVACSKPRATACREGGRLVDLGHAQDADEEVARGPLLGSRHGQLHVVEPIEGHATDLASTGTPAGTGSQTP
jgi:hypothetical protein